MFRSHSPFCRMGSKTISAFHTEPLAKCKPQKAGEFCMHLSGSAVCPKAIGGRRGVVMEPLKLFDADPPEGRPRRGRQPPATENLLKRALQGAPSSFFTAYKGVFWGVPRAVWEYLRKNTKMKPCDKISKYRNFTSSALGRLFGKAGLH